MPHRRTPAGEGVAVWLTVVAAVLLEALPVTTVLAVVAAANEPPTAPLLPFWWIVTVLLAAWGVAAAWRGIPEQHARRRDVGLALRAVIVLGFACATIASLLISPAAYGGRAPGDFPSALAADVVAGNGRLGAALALSILMAYLWWRGLLLGTLPLTRSRLYVRFVVGLAAVILLVAAASAVTGRARGGILAFLALALPAEVFIGLLGVALGQVLDTAREHRQRRRTDEPSGAIMDRSWVMTAVGISIVVVLGGLMLGLVVSYQGVATLLAAARPLADVMGTVLAWLIAALAFILFLVFNGPYTWLKQQAGHNSAPSPTQPPPATSKRFTPTPLPLGFSVAAETIVIALIVLAALLVVLWALRRYNTWHQTSDFEETRETLRAGDVLGAQVRALLGGLRRHPAAAHPREEPLPAGSVRFAFREVLRAAADAGLARMPGETADEFVLRLTRAARGADAPATEASAVAPDAVAPANARWDADARALGAAYDEARYGRPLGDATASAGALAAAAAFVAWLHAHATALAQVARPRSIITRVRRRGTADQGTAS